MSDVKVQRGTVDVGNTGSTDTLTAVSALSSAFEYNSNNFFTQGGSVSSGSNMEADDMSGLVELTALDTITLSRQAASLSQNMRFDWQVIEYIGNPGGANEFIVRSRNLITMSGASGSATLDTTPTNIDRCVPFITGVRTTQVSNQGDELRVLAYINDSGQLIVEKGSTTNTTVVQVVTVEFTGSNWNVFHGTVTTANDTGAITLNTDSDGVGGSTGDVTDWATAFIEASFTSTDQGLDSIACRYGEGAGTTTVNFDFQSGNSTSHKHFVHVVQNDNLSVTRYTPSGSLANDTNVSITTAGLTSLDSAMIIGTCQGSGGGTAYGRNWRNYRITSLTNAQHYCHRSGNTINHNIQIIDFEGVEDTGGGTDVNVSVNKQTLSITQRAVTATTEQTINVGVNKQSLSITQQGVSVTAEQNVSVSVNKQAVYISQYGASVTTQQNVSVPVNKQALSVSQYGVGVTTSGSVDVGVNKQSLVIDQKSVGVTAQQNVNISVSKQSLSILQRSVSVTTQQSVTANINSQSVGITQHSVTVSVGGSVSVGINKQDLTITQRPVSVSAEQNISVGANKQSLSIGQHSVSVSTGVQAGINKQSVSISQHSVSATTVRNIAAPVSKQSVLIDQKPVSVSIDTEVGVNNQSLSINQYGVSVNAEISVFSVNATVNKQAITINQHPVSMQTEDVWITSAITKEIVLNSRITKEITLPSKITKTVYLT